MQLRTAVLLQGAAGSGKCAAVHAAAAALGVHVVPYLCSSLQACLHPLHLLC